MKSVVFQKYPSIIRATEKQRKREREREVVAAPEAPIVPPWQWLILWAWTLFWMPAWISLWPDMIINTLFSIQLWPCTGDTSLFDGQHIHNSTWPFIKYWYDAEKELSQLWKFFWPNPSKWDPPCLLGNILASMLDPHYLTCPLFALLGVYVLLSFLMDAWTPLQKWGPTWKRFIPSWLIKSSPFIPA